MIFRHFARDLFKRLPEWDVSSRLSLGLAAILLVLLLLISFVGPEQIKWPARFGAFGLLLTLQLVIFWGNRRAISPYHEAQQHYVRGEYESARELLEQIPESGRQSVDALVLLGNSYRQLGQFDKSARAIERALRIKPDYHYGLYAAGKLKLVSGEYAEARHYIERAHALGAPDIVHFDLGQACYFQGEREKAAMYFRMFCESSSDEAAKIALANYYLGTLTQSTPPPIEQYRESINYWKKEAARYPHSSYGKAILNDVCHLQKTVDDLDASTSAQPAGSALRARL